MVLTNQLIYLVNVKAMRKIFSNYVCFSESPNFNNCIKINIKIFFFFFKGLSTLQFEQLTLTEEKESLQFRVPKFESQ